MATEKPTLTQDEIKAAIRDLRLAFPKLVFPFTVGIRKAMLDDLDARGIPYDPAQVDRALALTCRGPLYLRRLAAGGAMRHDLRGKPVEPVSPADQSQARWMLRRKMKKGAA